MVFQFRDSIVRKAKWNGGWHAQRRYSGFLKQGKVTTVRMGRLSPLISGPPHARRHSSVPDALSSRLNIRRPCVMLMRALEVGPFECCSMHPTNRRFGEVPGADSRGFNFYKYPAHVVIHDLAVTRFGR